MTTLFSSLGKFRGQGSLAGYSPWSRKESDMTKVTEVGICVGMVFVLIYLFIL